MLHELVMRLVVMLVYMPEMAAAVAGRPIGGTDATSLWKVAAAATAIPIDYQTSKNLSKFQ